MNLLGLGKAKTIEPLSENMAVNLAGDIINDSLIFGVAVVIIILEYKRSSQNSELERTQKLEEKLALQRKMDGLEFQIEKQNAVIRELRREMYDLSDRNRSRFSRLFEGNKPKTGEKEITLVVKSDDKNNEKDR